MRSMVVSLIWAVSVDLSGRKMAVTGLGVLDAHGYLYAGAQAMVLRVLLDMIGSPWPVVFLAMAATRLIPAAMISRAQA